MNMNPYKIPYVSVVNGRVVYRPRVTTKDFKDVDLNQDSRGFLKPPIRLGKQGDSHDTIMQAYLAAKKTLLHETLINKKTLGYISSQYLRSQKFKEKAGSTQRGYKIFAKSILSHPMKINSENKTLADIDLSNLTKPIMNAIREVRLNAHKEKSQSGIVKINRETTYLSTAIKWGLNHIPELPGIPNPLDNIEKYKEQPNTRYVTDDELRIQCKEAIKIADYLPSLIRLSFLLGTRSSETIDIRDSDLINEGVSVARRKGSKDNIIVWSEVLLQEVEKAKNLRRKRDFIPIDPYLLTNTKGDKLTASAVQSAMGRLKKLMNEKGLGDVFFTLHKTKSKAQSDSQDSDISGLTNTMKDRYSTKKKNIETGLK